MQQTEEPCGAVFHDCAFHHGIMCFAARLEWLLPSSYLRHAPRPRSPLVYWVTLRGYVWDVQLTHCMIYLMGLALAAVLGVDGPHHRHFLRQPLLLLQYAAVMMMETQIPYRETVRPPVTPRQQFHALYLAKTHQPMEVRAVHASLA